MVGNTFIAPKRPGAFFAIVWKHDDFFLLHGDLVFDSRLIIRLLEESLSSLVCMNKNIPLPDKDFKGLLFNGKVIQISVDLFSENAFFIAPLYKIMRNDFAIWMQKIEEFRRHAENKLGNQFDIRGFHDVILGGGALPMPLLETRVNNWIAEQQP